MAEEAFDLDRLPGRGNSPEDDRYGPMCSGWITGIPTIPRPVIAAAVNPADKILYIYDEHYQKRMLNSDIAEMIRRKGYAKERIRADGAEPKSNEELRRLGITRLRAADKGRDSVQSGIARLQEYDILVHPRCCHTLEELGSYRFQETAEGMLNRPEDRNNHLMDALRYAMEDCAEYPGRSVSLRRGCPAFIRRTCGADGYRKEEGTRDLGNFGRIYRGGAGADGFCRGGFV